MIPIIRDAIQPLGKRQPDIFLSHNSQDKPIVRKLAKHLNRFGLDAWLDDWELEIGDSLHESIGRALEGSRYVGIVITKSFLESNWCMNELRQTLSRESRERAKVALPLLLENTPPPPFLEDRVYVDLGSNYHRGLVRLTGLLHKFPPKKISDVLESKTYSDIRDIWLARSALLDMGWNRKSLVDKDVFEEVRSILESEGIPIEGEVIWLKQDILQTLSLSQSATSKHNLEKLYSLLMELD